MSCGWVSERRKPAGRCRRPSSARAVRKQTITGQRTERVDGGEFRIGRDESRSGRRWWEKGGHITGSVWRWARRGPHARHWYRRRGISSRRGRSRARPARRELPPERQGGAAAAGAERCRESPAHGGGLALERVDFLRHRFVDRDADEPLSWSTQSAVVSRPCSSVRADACASIS